MMKVAYFTPLNPKRTGISDYSEELLPRLAELVDIDLVIDDYRPETDSIREQFRLRRADEFLRHRSEYDVALYHIGNNYHYHAYMFPCMRVVPGVVVLHDFCLSYLISGLTLGRGELGTLIDVLRRTAPESVVSNSARLLLSLVDPYELPLSQPVIEMARGVVVHSEFARARAQAASPTTRIEHIPHAIEILDDPRGRRELRADLGLDPEDFIVASVSRLSYNKRLEKLLEALRDVRGSHPQVKLLVISDGPLGASVKRLIRDLHLEDAVTQTGWVPKDRYLELIRAADVVADFRYPSAGETSGSILRAMEAGKPLIVGDHGFFHELSDAFSIKLPPGEETAGLGRAISTLVSDDSKRESMARAAREYVRANLTWKRAARSYARLLEDLPRSGGEPVDPRALPPPRAGALERSTVKSVYRLFRLGYLYRHYGLTDTLARVRRELGGSS